jgi:hypothetical protein
MKKRAQVHSSQMDSLEVELLVGAAGLQRLSLFPTDIKPLANSTQDVGLGEKGRTELVLFPSLHLCTGNPFPLF